MEKEKKSTDNTKVTTPQESEGLFFFLFKQKQHLYIGLALLIVAVFFIPINGKSLIERITEVRVIKIKNIAPNPGFETGSGDAPAGWTTK